MQILLFALAENTMDNFVATRCVHATTKSCVLMAITDTVSQHCQIELQVCHDDTLTTQWDWLTL